MRFISLRCLLFLIAFLCGLARSGMAQGAPDARTLGRIEQLLDEAHRLVAERDFDALSSLVDLERLLPLARVEGWDATDREDFVAGFHRGFTAGLGDAKIQVEERSIVRVEVGELPGDWVVTELNRVAVEDYRVFRFWIASRPESEMRFTDFGEVFDGNRLSVQMAAILSSDARIGKGSLAFTRGAKQVNALIAEGDIEAARREIRRLVKWSVADSLLPLRRTFPIKLQWMQSNWEQSLALLEGWGTGMPRPPIHECIAMDAHVGLGNYEQALSAAERFMQATGPHPYAYEVKGLALSWLGRRRECMQAWDASLKLDASHLTSLLYMAGLAEAEHDELLLGHLRSFMPLAEYFDNFGGDLIDRERWRTLEMFCDELNRREPDNPNIVYYTASRLLGDGGSPRAAFSTLLEVLPHTDDEFYSYFEMLLLACARVGTLEGQPAWNWIYSKFPEQQQVTFEYFAEEFAWDDVESLTPWVDKHKQSHPDDREPLYYLAVIAEMKDDYGAAALKYAQALSVWPADDLEDRSLMFGRQIHCLLMDGQLEYAFRNVKPREQAWESILDFCYQGDFAGLLKMALDLRFSESPRDPELSLWRGFEAWLFDDYERASSQFSGADLWLERIDDRGYQYYFFQYAVRSHIRSGALDEALKLGQQVTEFNADPFFEALARAALGQDEKAQALLLACLENYWELDDFRDDYDLKSHLSRPGFSKLRDLLDAQ